MFERVRHSRSKRLTNERQTQKVQRGGDFAVVGTAGAGIPAAAAATDGADIAIWHAGIDAAGLGGTALDLKILFTMVPVATTDTTDPLRAKRINTWFKLIGEQNKVILIVVTHVQRIFLKRLLTGFTPAGGGPIPPVTPLTRAGSSYTTAAEIDALQGEELTNLVTEYADKLKLDYAFLQQLFVRLMIQFEAVMNMGLGTNFKAVIPTNKMEEMFSLRQKDKVMPVGGPRILYTKIVAELEGCMINPQRLESIVPEEVSHIIRMYKDIPTLLNDINRIHPLPARAVAPRSIADVNEKETNLRILVERLSQHVYATTMLRTGKEVQDGWVLGGRPVFLTTPLPAPVAVPDYYDPYTVTDFFFDFFTTLSAQFVPASNSFTLSRIVGSVPPAATDDANKLGILAAKLLIAKLNGNFLEDLYPSPAPAPFYVHPKTVGGGPGTNFVGIPDPAYYSVAYKPGKTLEEMYKWIDSNIDAYFLLHLQYQLNLP